MRDFMRKALGTASDLAGRARGATSETISNLGEQTASLRTQAMQHLDNLREQAQGVLSGSDKVNDEDVEQAVEALDAFNIHLEDPQSGKVRPATNKESRTIAETVLAAALADN